MSSQPSPDFNYLQGTVGEALARGCAAVAAAQPSDPVDYLGHWLLRFVKNAEIEKKFFQEKEETISAKKAEESAKLESERAELAREQEKAAAIQALAEMRDEPRQLFAAAVELLLKYTSASAAYVAALADAEEADWAGDDGEDAGDEGDGPAETDDDAPKDGDEEEEEEEEEAAEEEDDEDGPKVKVEVGPDYSKKHLAYLVASKGQEFVAGVDLRRPGGDGDADGDEGKAELPAVTFRMLDEKIPMLVVPQVAAEPRTKFFSRMPKIGGYQACAVSLASGEYKAVLAADSLIPEGHGQPLSLDDNEFIWQASLALSKAYDASHKAAAGEASKNATAGATAMAALKARIEEIKPPGSLATGGEAEAEEEEEGEPEVEVEEGEDELIATLRAQVGSLEGKLPRAEGKEEATREALAIESEVLKEVVGALVAAKEPALAAFRCRLVVPQATYHAVKAVLHMLGKEPSTFSSWKLCYPYFAAGSSSLFEEMAGYDATQERDVGRWQKVRSCYKAVKKTKLLDEEFPDTCIGSLLLTYVKQVRRVARRAAAHRAAEKAVADVRSTLETKQKELEVAEKAKEEREAAEAAAAAAAAAAADAEGEEGEEGEEEEEDD